jgi:hypothetical protein
MALTFPSGYPESFLGPVVSAAAKAESEFREDMRAVQSGDTASVKRAAVKCIATIAVAFENALCAAVRDGDPFVDGVSLIANRIEEFFPLLSSYAYSDLMGFTEERDFPEEYDRDWDLFAQEMRSAVLESPEWTVHLAERATFSILASGEIAVPEHRKGVEELTVNRPTDVSENVTPSLPADASAEQKRQAVRAYIEEVTAKTGRRIPRAALWRTVGYGSRTDFERWVRNDPKSTKTADERFRQLLVEKPHLKDPQRGAKRRLPRRD